MLRQGGSMSKSTTLNINGALTDKGLSKPGYLVILAGQSNGTDRFIMSGNLQSQYQGVQSDCYTYYKPFDNTDDNGSWQQINSGVNTGTGTPATGKFGVGVLISNRIKALYDKTVYILPTAVGGSFIAADIDPTWNSGIPGYYYTRSIREHFRKAVAKLGGVDFTPVIVWVHGESDSDTLAHGNAYEANLTALINKYRIDTGYPDLKVIITRLRSDYGGASLGLSQVRAAQLNIVANVQNVYLYDTDTALSPLSVDGQHYNPITNNFGGVQSAINIGNGLADLINSILT